MTVSRFSLSAYHDLRDAGELSRQESKVFETVATHGPMTREEIEAASGIRLGSVCGRVKKMIEKGVLVEVGEKKNPYSGKANGLLDLSLAESAGHASSLIADSAASAIAGFDSRQAECAL